MRLPAMTTHQVPALTIQCLGGLPPRHSVSRIISGIAHRLQHLRCRRSSGASRDA
jgi:hypothetical protein